MPDIMNDDPPLELSDGRNGPDSSMFDVQGQAEQIFIISNGEAHKDSKTNNATKDKLESGVEVENQTLSQDITDDDDDAKLGPWSRFVERIETAIGSVYIRHKSRLTLGVKIVLFLAYIAYFAYCCQYRYSDEGSIILTVITAFIVIKIINDTCSSKLQARLIPCLSKLGSSTSFKRWRTFMRYGLYVASFASLCVYLGCDVLSTHPGNSRAIIGVALLIVLVFLGSYSPSRVNWHPVFWGFIIQFFFAVLTLRTTAGYETFKWIGDLVFNFVALSDKGSEFVFGDSFKHTVAGFFMDSAGVLVFFNACIFMLDHWGILEFIVLKIGRGLSFCLETGPVESVVAAANIFVGLAEAPLIVRPYLPTITRSELHAIMTCGFASISGAFMAMFIKAGAPANHLLTASVISAPAGLALSKLMYPEVEKVVLSNQQNVKVRGESMNTNALQACSEGAAFSIKLIGSIMVNMLAFVSLMNLIDHLLVWIGDRAGVEDMTFDLICSYILYPLAYVIGVPPDDCGKVGSLIGVKMMATPFVAYRYLGVMIKNRHLLETYQTQVNGSWYWSGKNVLLEATNTTLVNGFISERAEVITTYALCGISAFPAIGFSMGTLVPMCPPRKKDVIRVVIRAFIAGNLANFATAAVAGPAGVRGNERADKLAEMAIVTSGRAMNQADIRNALRDMGRADDEAKDHLESTVMNRLREHQFEIGDARKESHSGKSKEYSKPAQNGSSQSAHTWGYTGMEIGALMDFFRV